MDVSNVKIRKLLLFSAALLNLLNQGIADDGLDKVLLRDIIPPISDKCKTNSEAFSNQVSNFTFTHSVSPSFWDPIALPYEDDIFLAEMSNVNSENQNKSWAIRLGQSGNLYSFRGAYGEAIPPQYYVNGQFVDEVTQSVSVSLENNNDPSNPYFIHQSGVYMRDGDYTYDNPFFSPSLAKYCSDKECSFGSWGQQAHLPTTHKSDVLYFNSYRDCGDGIIETTSVFHNNADLITGDSVNYLNVPWGGVRYSTLRDLLLSKPDGSMEVQFQLGAWGGPDLIRNIEDTGGFSTFGEEVIVSDEVYDENPYIMPVQDGETLRVIIKEEDGARRSNFHSDTNNLNCMRVPVIAQFQVTTGARLLWLENSRTQEKIISPIVLHWSWAGDTLYVCTKEEDIDTDDFNDIFKKDDEILVSYSNAGKPFEDNLALTYVHGDISADVGGNRRAKKQNPVRYRRKFTTRLYGMDNKRNGKGRSR